MIWNKVSIEIENEYLELFLVMWYLSIWFMGLLSMMFSSVVEFVLWVLYSINCVLVIYSRIMYLLVKNGKLKNFNLIFGK